MDSFMATLGVGIVMFASTNIDDLVILAALFASAMLSRRAVVLGQYAGIGVLVLVSSVAALLAITVPERWLALLGMLPLLIGIHALWTLRDNAKGNAEGVNEGMDGDVDADKIVMAPATHHWHSPILAVAAVTVANGGDNLGVYIPVFANAPAAIPLYALIFAVMTGLWCLLSERLVSHPRTGTLIRRYGDIVLPFVLILLGLWLLSGAL